MGPRFVMDVNETTGTWEVWDDTTRTRLDENLTEDEARERIRQFEEGGDGLPEEVWLVQRRADFGARVEILGVHCTRAGAQAAADDRNVGFTGERQFGAQLRRLPGAWLHEVPGLPPDIEITE